MPRGKKGKGAGGGGGGGATTNAPARSEPPKPIDEPSSEDNEALKLRLVEAKERLSRIQEVIGAIGTENPADAVTNEALNVESASTKVQYIENVVASTSEIADESLASASGGTNKKKKHKKAHNNNPPPGCPIASLTPPPVIRAPTPKTAESTEEDIDDTTESQGSKKKRNRNKKKKQNEQAGELKTNPVEIKSVDPPLPSPEVKALETISVETSKESTPGGDNKKKSKKNKNKNKNKEQNENESETLPDNEIKSDIAEIKDTDKKAKESKNETLEVHVKTDDPKPSMDSNTAKSNKKKNKGQKDDSSKSLEAPGKECSKLGENIEVAPKQDKVEKTEITEKEKREQEKIEKPEHSLPGKEQHTKSKVMHTDKAMDQCGSAEIWSILDEPMESAENKRKNKKNNKRETSKPTTPTCSGSTVIAPVETNVQQTPLNPDSKTKTVELTADLINKVTTSTSAKEIDTQGPKELSVPPTTAAKSCEVQTSAVDIATTKLEEKTSPTTEIVTETENKLPVLVTQSGGKSTKQNKQGSQPAKAENTMLATDKKGDGQIKPNQKGSGKQKQELHQTQKKEVVVIPEHENIDQKPKIETRPKSETPSLPKETDKPQDSVPAKYADILEKPMETVNPAQNPTPIPAATPTLSPAAISVVSIVPNKEMEKQLLSESLTKLIDTVPESKKLEVKEEKQVAKESASKSEVSQNTSIDKKHDVPTAEAQNLSPSTDAQKSDAINVPKVDVKQSGKKDEKPAQKPDGKGMAKSEGKTATTLEGKDLQKHAADTSKQETIAASKTSAKAIPKPKAEVREPLPQTEQQKPTSDRKETPKVDSKESATNENKETPKSKQREPPSKQEEPSKVNILESSIAELPKPEGLTKAKETLPQKMKTDSQKIEKPETSEAAAPVTELSKKIAGTPEPKAHTPELVDIPLTSSSTSIAETSSITVKEPSKLSKKEESKSKKDQKAKPNKLKSKAPQPPSLAEESPPPPPDIPMDMSLLSKSMLDSAAPTATSSLPATAEEQPTEEDASLIFSDSKNVQRSDFVQSVDLVTDIKDEAKSLRTNKSEGKVEDNNNKVTELVRETKNVSPTTNKRNKETANLKQSEEIQETKIHELPEKTAQQKIDSVQVSAVQLMDILEPKMTTSAATKLGSVVGTVRTSPRTDPKKKTAAPDHLQPPQQQRKRSKSPKDIKAAQIAKNQRAAAVQGAKSKDVIAKDNVVEIKNIDISAASINKTQTENKTGAIPKVIAKPEKVVESTQPAENVLLTADEKLASIDVFAETNTINKKTSQQTPPNAATQKPQIPPKPENVSKPAQKKMAPNIPAAKVPQKSPQELDKKTSTITSNKSEIPPKSLDTVSPPVQTSEPSNTTPITPATAVPSVQPDTSSIPAATKTDSTKAATTTTPPAPPATPITPLTSATPTPRAPPATPTTPLIPSTPRTPASPAKPSTPTTPQTPLTTKTSTSPTSPGTPISAAKTDPSSDGSKPATVSATSISPASLTSTVSSVTTKTTPTPVKPSTPVKSIASATNAGAVGSGTSITTPTSPTETISSAPSSTAPKPTATASPAIPIGSGTPITPSPPSVATKPSTTVAAAASPPLNNDLKQKPEVPPRPQNLVSSPQTKKPLSTPSPSSSVASSPSPHPYDEEEYVEYKFSPRPVFMCTICHVCKIPLQSFVHCKLCQMISYCTVEHLVEDEPGHRSLCNAIQEIAKKRGGHIYNNARILNDDDYRSLRVHTLNICENTLKRHLQPFERELLLFPRLCFMGNCREWRQNLLTECKDCGQVSHCIANPDHLPAIHSKWCNAFSLYQKLVMKQKSYGRIEPSLPSKIMLKPYLLPNNIDETFKNLYKNYGAIKDECTYAALTQLATAPLTAYYGSQHSLQMIGECYTIHLIGAELQFEADTLDKWETFFLHLVPQLLELRIVFVGPELNAENLPLEILSRIRMCRTCRQNCRAVKFDFQCGKLYHNYVQSKAFTKPDLVCFFNPGLYRSTGYNGLDTWPDTIKSAVSFDCPIIVTSYTEVEAPRDLDRLQKEAGRDLAIIQGPHVNPFSSQRPERNFISDEIAPMIFKNYFCFVCK